MASEASTSIRNIWDHFSSLFLARRDACVSHLDTTKNKIKINKPEPKPVTRRLPGRIITCTIHLIETNKTLFRLSVPNFSWQFQAQNVILFFLAVFRRILSQSCNTLFTLNSMPETMISLETKIVRIGICRSDNEHHATWPTLFTKSYSWFPFIQHFNGTCRLILTRCCKIRST